MTLIVLTAEERAEAVLRCARAKDWHNAAKAWRDVRGCYPELFEEPRRG